ncbi:MAG: hypothetical protein ABIF71_12365 [Planctomycetota bacterium]
MLSWNHSGFGADIGPALVPDVSADRPTRTRQEGLLAYMVRVPVAAGRISTGDDGTVIYKAGEDKPFDPGYGLERSASPRP